MFLKDWSVSDLTRFALRLDRAAMYNSTDFEHQNMSCVLNGGAGSGGNSSFSISFRQGTTDVMSGNVTISELEGALKSLHTIGDVEVSTRTGVHTVLGTRAKRK